MVSPIHASQIFFERDERGESEGLGKRRTSRRVDERSIWRDGGMRAKRQTTIYK
jgi:hypothetical protein